MGCSLPVRSRRKGPSAAIGDQALFETVEPRLLLSATAAAHNRASVTASPAAIIIAPVDVINGTSGDDTITLRRNPDSTYVDWTVSGSSVTYQVVITDPNGLTINGLGGNDVINLDYGKGNPLPNIVHFNGTFTVNGLQGATPLADTTFEIGQSTLYFGYTPGSSPATTIQSALTNGFNGGVWNGSAASPGGAITSQTAAARPAGVFGIGFADSADGVVVGQPANTVEVRYTVMGDANLDRVVNSADAVIVGRNYLVPDRANWDQGNFNYDSTINLTDAQILQNNYNVVASGSATAADASVTASTASQPTMSDTGDLLNSLTTGKDRKGHTSSRGWRASDR
jgi:hypothetical protein